MEEKAAAAEQRRLRTLAEAEERRKQWEAAMAQAKEDYAEVWRAEELKRMVERWRFVREAREDVLVADEHRRRVLDAADVDGERLEALAR